MASPCFKIVSQTIVPREKSTQPFIIDFYTNQKPTSHHLATLHCIPTSKTVMCIVLNFTELDLIDLIENVQRSFTRRLSSLSHLPCHSRLSQLNLEPFELRRIRLDLICYHKVLTALTPFDQSRLFSFFSHQP